MKYDLIIIGAGAAGLFAAANVPAGLKVLVLEKTGKPGQKLLLTGNGQCNLTNAEPISEFLNRYGNNGKKLRPVLFPFSNSALIDYFEKNSLPLKTREDGKIFPASGKSSDVLAFLLNKCKKNGVEIKYNSPVTELIKKDIKNKNETSNKNNVSDKNNNEPYKYLIKTSSQTYETKNVLVATGGASYPQTGSDGEFFSCLERFGIELIPCRPALTPIFIKNYPYKNQSGLAVLNTTVTIMQKNSGKTVKSIESLLLTHKGFSGPVILNLSGYITPGDSISINFMTGKNSTEMRKEFIESAKGNSVQINTLLSSIANLPRGLSKQICRNVDIAAGEKASRLSGHEMGCLAERITNDTHEISEVGGYSVAMTTTGGVSLDEINLHTTEAKNHPGLFFAGEVLDVNGDTGGYNIQFAFSSAISAVRNIG